MNVELHNIGILETADVALDGLTVITGFNDSGKSTVGKALYSLYHGMNSYLDSIESDRNKFLTSFFPRFAINKDFIEQEGRRGKYNYRALLYSIIENYFLEADENDSERKYDISDLKMQIEAVLRKAGFVQNDITILLAGFENRFQEVIKPTFLLKVKEDVVLQTFSEEFAGQCINVFKESQGYIKISDEASKYEIYLSDDEIHGLDGNIANSLSFENVVLVDTPMVLNNMLDNRLMINAIHPHGHQQELIKKIMKRSEKLMPENIIERSIKKEQTGIIRESLNEIDKVLKGNISTEEGELIYEIKDKKLRVSSLASGLKTYVIIKKLIENGYLNAKSLLIIDEPEVHLHPEWQVKFAEILTLLQKEIDIHILLTTHSPYFLQAIDVFSRKHKISGKTHFYLAERNDDSAVMKKIDGNLEETYKMLAEPFVAMKSLDEDLLYYGGE